MRAVKLFILLLIVFTSCNNSNSFSVSKIIDGNTVEISNGLVVKLNNVSPTAENVKILERYLKGNIYLYDENNDEITKFSSDQISAVIYNSDGDCINDIITGINKITTAEKPIIKDPNKVTETTVIKMESENGVFKVPAEINGISLYFIFDTGASLISISLTEAKRLFNMGKLEERDFIGKSKFSDAIGNISEGTIINLKEVKIGDRTLNNVQACIIHSLNAPLLLGQSALQKFGQVSIDYERSEITFK
ncbi:MAG: retropepsin-like aspartic protease [Bacteroidetes bacterium]|nr:retropepsin-like aspartic protease [Bacteroidota bacterium]